MDNQKIANISVVEPALPPIKPVKPKKILNIILSIILGSVAGLGVAFSSEYFSHGFNNSEDVEKHLGLKVLASIPEMK
jgi:capsular polysaccharide biosynthesis protein